LKSKHVVICNHGFWQENVRLDEWWENVTAYFKHAEVFAMAWSSGSSELFLTKDNVNRGTKKQGKSSIVSNLLSIVNTGKKQFMYAEDQARITGILLGYFLAKSGFGDNRAITLIGYSLGSVVNFNCLKTMKRLYDRKIQKAALVLNDC